MTGSMYVMWSWHSLFNDLDCTFCEYGTIAVFILRFLKKIFMLCIADSQKEMQEELTQFNMDVNAAPAPPVYLRREREDRPSFNPPKHPHGCMPPTQVHPHTGQGRVLTYGNDNSTVSRQSRIQSQRPDPVPGK